MTDADIAHLFAHHPPTGGKAARHEAVRGACRMAATVLLRECPASPELTLAVRKLQEAMMWGNAAVAMYAERSPDPQPDLPAG